MEKIVQTYFTPTWIFIKNTTLFNTFFIYILHLICSKKENQITQIVRKICTFLKFWAPEFWKQVMQKFYCKIIFDRMYSGANWKVYKYCLMKQKCQLQSVRAHYKNTATPLRTRGIYTTHQHFQMRCITLIYLKGFKSYYFICVVSVVKHTLHFYFNQ